MPLASAGSGGFSSRGRPQAGFGGGGGARTGNSRPLTAAAQRSSMAQAAPPTSPPQQASASAPPMSPSQRSSGPVQVSQQSGPVQRPPLTPPIQPPNLNLSTNIGNAPTNTSWQQPTDSDPRLSGLANEAASWQQGLAAGKDQDAVLAMQRMRDLQSGQMREMGDALAVEGGFGGARSQRLAMLGVGQQRDLAGLNADLTAGARAAQESAFQTRGGLEAQLAQERLARGGQTLQANTNQNQQNLNTWQAQQAATQGAQQLNLGAWQAAQNATAQQQQLALQAQQANNQAYLQANQLRPDLFQQPHQPQYRPGSSDQWLTRI